MWSDALELFQELLHVFETSPSAVGLAAGLQGAEQRIQTLLEALHQSQMDLDDVAELRRVALEVDVQITHLQVGHFWQTLFCLQ